MTLTDSEQKMCNQYGQVGTDGKVHCSECPLVIDKRFCLCKANCTEEEWEALDKKMTKKAELKARRKMVFDLRTSGMTINEISKKIGKSTYVVTNDIDAYLSEKSIECKETCINCKHLKISDHLDSRGIPWDDVDRYCTKLKRKVYGMNFCDNYEKLEHPRCLCEECVNYIDLYYYGNPHYIGCKIHGRWTAKSTCSKAVRKEDE